MNKRLLILIVLVFVLVGCAPAAAPNEPLSVPEATDDPTSTRAPAVTLGPGLEGANIDDIAAVQAAKQALVGYASANLEEIQVLAVESVMWRDSCLGITLEGMLCLEVITPGYRINLTWNDQVYEAHTNEDGSKVLFAQLIPTE